MLKIRAKQSDRQLVQELAAEYISGKFHELKGDYESLAVRLDAIQAKLSKLDEIDKIKTNLLSDIELEKKSIADMKADLRGTIEVMSNEIGETKHRLEDVEDHLGI